MLEARSILLLQNPCHKTLPVSSASITTDNARWRWFPGTVNAV
jgi:hypothetical protein